jgi:hypothetical protein
MKKSKVIIYRSLYFTGKIFSWRRLMLFAGASLLAASQACRPTQKMCYEIASPNDTIQSQTQSQDSLYLQIDCYEIAAPPDSSVFEEQQNIPDKTE